MRTLFQAFAIVAILGSCGLAVAQYGNPYGPGGAGPTIPTPGYNPPSYNPGPSFDPSPGFGNSPGFDPFPEPPTYTPPDFGVPQYEYVYEQYCTNCNKKVSSSASVGQHCPHCGVLWTTSDTNPGYGGSSGWAGSGSGSRAWGGAIGIAVAIVIGVIGFAIRMAASSNSH